MTDDEDRILFGTVPSWVVEPPNRPLTPEEKADPSTFFGVTYEMRKERQEHAARAEERSFAEKADESTFHDHGSFHHFYSDDKEFRAAVYLEKGRAGKPIVKNEQLIDSFHPELGYFRSEFTVTPLQERVGNALVKPSLPPKDWAASSDKPREITPLPTRDRDKDQERDR